MLKQLRAWARGHTSKRRYSPVGVAFHWGMAAFIIFMLALGWHMGRVQAGGGKQAVFAIHMTLGLTTLVLSVLRLMWRVLIPGPVNDADNLGVQTLVANATHAIFYVCFIGLPVSGWLMWSAFAGGETLAVFGVTIVKPFPFAALDFEQKRSILYWAGTIHQVLIWTLLLLIPAHAGAALKHHFWDRHDVLEGMLPLLAGEEPPKAKRRKRKARRSPLASRTG